MVLSIFLQKMSKKYTQIFMQTKIRKKQQKIRIWLDF